MLFSWNNDTIKWYEAASEYTGFYKNLASAVEPMVKGAGTFADMGCGIGLVDLELAPSVGNVLCVDVSEQATAYLRGRVRARGIENIDVIQANCFDIDKVFDVIYLCFFSSRDIERFLPKCKKLISVVGGDNNAPLFPQSYRKKSKNTIEGEKQYLDGLHLSYRLKECEFEFGQPLETREDAGLYVRTYAPEIPQEELDGFLESRLIRTGSEKYPFYMPRKKMVGIFEVDGSLR